MNIKKKVFTSKNILLQDNHYAEVFIDQVRKITNQEVIFEEYAIQMYFNTDGLWDPTLLNEAEGESTPLGTIANYRNKYVVSL